MKAPERLKASDNMSAQGLAESELGKRLMAEGRNSKNAYFIELQKLFEDEGKSEEEIDILNEINEGRRLRIEATDSEDKGVAFFEFYLERIKYYKEHKVMPIRKLHLYIKGVFGNDLGTEAIRMLGMNPTYREEIIIEAKGYRDQFATSSSIPYNEMIAKHVRERAFQIRDEYGLTEAARFSQGALMIEAARILNQELQKGESIERGR